MAEKTPNQQLAEKLLYKPAYVAEKDADVKQKAHDFAEGYKKFLDAGKTEREVAAESGIENDELRHQFQVYMEASEFSE